MAITAAVLQGGIVLTTTSAPVYTAPAATTALVKRAVFNNATTSTVYITVTLQRAAGPLRTLVSGQAIAGNSSYVAPEFGNLVLAAGDVVTALAGAASAVTCFISGFTIA